MSKEEFLKIQTCVLKVNIHCDGCKQKVKKILQKIDGVYKTNIDAEQGKVTVSGNVDPATLIKKLNKAGKHAELWGAQKPSNNQQNQLNNQLKNLQIDNGKGGNNNKKAQKGGGQQQPPKGGQQQQQQQQLQLQQQQQLQLQQQLQQLQQAKAFQDLKLPQFKNMNMPFKEVQNPKAVKFNLPPEEDLSDDELDDYDDDDDFDDEEFDDEVYDLQPLNKMKPMMGNAVGGGLGPQGGHPMMLNGMMNGQQFMNAQQPKGGNNGGGGGGGGNGGGNNGGKKGGGGGGGDIPVQVHVSGGGKNGGKNSGGTPGDVKNGHSGGAGGSGNKDGNNGHGGGIGGKKGGGSSDGIHAGGGPGNVNPVLNHGMGMGQMGPMGPIPMAQMANMQMGQMGGVPAVHGLPASAMNGGHGPGYLPGAPTEMMAPGNPYQQQYLAQMMMNQQRANGNERFQPLMYARPPPAVNYMAPYPYQYPPPGHPPMADPYTSYFSDENTSSCNIM
ncbi:hypothetical protein Ancab_030434 [Ancistrocladus abbreviatus]